MRDPKRINPLIEELRTYWLSHPDLRLCQIIGNFLQEYLDGPGFTCPDMSGRGYNVEDKEVHAYFLVKNMGDT